MNKSYLLKPSEDQKTLVAIWRTVLATMGKKVTHIYCEESHENQFHITFCGIDLPYYYCRLHYLLCMYTLKVNSIFWFCCTR